MKLNKYQKQSLLIVLLPILGILIAKITQTYRYSDYREIYLIGVFLVYFCWLSSFIWGIINAIKICLSANLKTKVKIFWISISLLPILYITIIPLLSSN